ncbi:EAL domain-containing protein [Vibrio maritimus]
MRLLQRLHVVLVPILLMVTVTAGTALYFWQLSEFKNLEQKKWSTKLTNSLNAANFERSGIEALGYEVSGSIQFINYLQSLGESSQRLFLENHIRYVLRQERGVELGGVAVYVIDPSFELTTSSESPDPFGPLVLPNDVYQPVFDAYVHVSTGDLFYKQGSAYRSIAGEIRYLSISAHHPKLLPDDKQAMSRTDRALLVVDGPLSQLNLLLAEINKLPSISIEFNQLSSELSPAEPITTKIMEREYIDGTLIDVRGLGLSMSLTILDEHYAPIESQLAVQLTLYMLVILIVMLFLIHWVVRSNIIGPINSLLNDIRRGGLELRYFKRAKGDDEVSTLKNAYIDSLSKVKFEAEFDSLTTLANRRSFIRFIEQRVDSHCNEQTYVVAWDIVDFRRLNDLHGQDSGDKLLQKIASEIGQLICSHQSKVGASFSDYSTSRFASNTFCALINASDDNEACDFMKHAEQRLHLASTFGDMGFNLHLAMAISPLCNQEQSYLWQKGLEAALNKAKRIKNQRCLVLFDQTLMTELLRKDEIEQVLFTCSKQGDFELLFMPLIDAKSYTVASIEVLVRCPALQVMGIGPEEFIPAAERANLIGDIDAWVIQTALAALNDLKQHTGYTGAISINISGLELYNNQFVEQLCGACSQHGISHDRVILEITETSYVESTKDTIAIILCLRDLGFKVSLDDFGTGYTAIQQLLNYPVDELKVDKSFVDHIGSDGNKERMLNSIISLGHSCNARVVGEGVESAYQCRYLTDIGCDYLQGYWFSEPLTFEDFCVFYTQHLGSELKSKVSDLTVIKR